MGVSEHDIKHAFHVSDDDGDDTLSVREAVVAVEKLAGRNVGPSAIESACRSCAVDVKSREMDFDEFVTIVRHLEDSGEI